MATKAQKISRFPNRIPVETAVALQAYIGKLPEYDFAITLGAETKNDGCGSNYYWNDTSTDTPDGVDVIKPTLIDLPDPGRWIRVNDICKTPRTDEIIVISDGTSLQVASHDLGTDYFDAQVTIVVTTFKTDLEVLIGRSDTQVEITFLNGSEPTVSTPFTVFLTEIVPKQVAGAP